MWLVMRCDKIEENYPNIGHIPHDRSAAAAFYLFQRMRSGIQLFQNPNLTPFHFSRLLPAPTFVFFTACGAPFSAQDMAYDTFENVYVQYYQY